MLQRLRELRPEYVGHRLSQDVRRAGGVGASMQLGGQDPDSSRPDRGLAERPSRAGALAP
jgi:hypothetical protein